MDALSLARLQFGVTTVYHFFFVPLTLGLSILVAIMESLYVKTGKQVYKDMTKFWGKLFLINFAMGVVTGIVQEFQFGMNWSNYSRFVGDVFGVPLAIEGLTAFFLESTFLGIWLFGWDKLSKKLHLTAIWLVAIGSNLSGLWILIANSFMQQPTAVDYMLNNGRAELLNFFSLLTNPNLIVMFPHTVASGLTTAAFFILAISMYHLLRKNQVDLYQKSFKIAAITALIASFAVILTGHEQGLHMIQAQPMKMAASEALWDTADPAPFSIITIFDSTGRNEIYSLKIPGGLSFLTYLKFSGKFEGINDLQAMYEEKYGAGDYVPPVPVLFWSFRIMVGSGFAMFGLGILAVWMVWKKKYVVFPRLMRIAIWAVLLPYLANTGGWLMTEIGRYPWVVYEVFSQAQGVSPNVPASSVLTSLILFTVVYAILMVVDIYLLAKYARQGAHDSSLTAEAESTPSLVEGY